MRLMKEGCQEGYRPRVAAEARTTSDRHWGNQISQKERNRTMAATKQLGLTTVHMTNARL